jgi:hypothetical protein
MRIRNTGTVDVYTCVLLAQEYHTSCGRVPTSCACVLLAHAYCLRIVRTACAWQRTDALSAASLLRCACSARKSSSGRTDCSRVRMRLLCSQTGHRQPITGLRTFAKSKKVTGIGEMNRILLYHNCRIRGSDQSCGSGCGRIRHFLPDSDPE